MAMHATLTVRDFFHAGGRGQQKQSPNIGRRDTTASRQPVQKKQLLPLDHMHAFSGLDPGRASQDLSAYRSKHGMLVCHGMKCIHELRPACGDTAVGDGVQGLLRRMISGEPHSGRLRTQKLKSHLLRTQSLTLGTDVPYRGRTHNKHFRGFQVWLFLKFICCIRNCDTEPTSVMSIV